MRHYGVLIRSIREGKPYIHMDDTMHETIHETYSEAMALHALGTELIGIFYVDEATGETGTLFNRHDTVEQIEHSVQQDLTRDEKDWLNRASRADDLYKARE